MRRISFIAAALLLSLPLCAQTTREEFRTRYDSQVRRVGVDGLGVETLLDRWEQAFPDDPDMLVGRFNYYLNKAASIQIVPKQQERFMGARPTLTLRDSLDNPVNYFQETFYEDSLFRLSAEAIDKAIKLYPDRLDLRFCKVTALMAYEKESPDMAGAVLSSLIDYDGTSNPVWKYGDEVAEDDLFASGVQEYCATLYSINSPASLEALKDLSEKMLKYDPKNTLFLSNMGTYYFIARKDYKNARKYYEKVLKLEPGNYTAIKNSVLMARRDGNVKQEKKYLELLTKYGADETEKASAQARLNALSTKKK